MNALKWTLRPTLTLLLLSTGCNDALPPAAVCDGEIVGTINTGPTEDVLRSDLVVTGTATHSGGLAIRNILVAGLPATNKTTNFSTWEATVSIESLVAMASPEGQVALEVIGIDACGEEFSLTEPVALTVDLTPHVIVEELELNVEIPSGETYLPANGSVAAIVLVTANADAANAAVAMEASIGAFQGLEGQSLKLAGNGQSQASGTVLYSATSAGTALLTATAENKLASRTVRVAGPPSVIPSSAALSAGQTATVTVSTEGRVKSCSAMAVDSQSILVTSGGVSLYGMGGGSDTNGDGKVDILVSASSALQAPAEVTITCCDPYLQCATGTYTATPSEQ